MRLEYFQMIDRVETLDLAAGRLTAHSRLPANSPVFEGHFPGMPLMPGTLMIETMAQASGLLVLGATGFAVMPFLVSVDSAKLRDFVRPSAALAISAEMEHDGSGFAVTRSDIRIADKRVAQARLKLKTVPLADLPLESAVRSRAAEIGLTAVMEASPAG